MFTNNPDFMSEYYYYFKMIIIKFDDYIIMFNT